jgi:hypothetical protein
MWMIKLKNIYQLSKKHHNYLLIVENLFKYFELKYLNKNYLKGFNKII